MKLEKLGPVGPEHLECGGRAAAFPAVLPILASVVSAASKEMQQERTYNKQSN
jgi:hypothetical protein